MSTDFPRIGVFVTVAHSGSFAAAGRELGYSGVSVAHRITRLEEELGVRLFERATSGVELTEMGRELFEAVGPAFDELQQSVRAVVEDSRAPRGMLRLRVSRAAESVLGAPFLAGFLERHLEIALDIAIAEDPHRIVGTRFDAGMGVGEVIDEGLESIPVSGDHRLRVVGAPAYFESREPPKRPRDLASHDCIAWKADADDPAPQWEFVVEGRWVRVAVGARVTSTDPALNLELALTGVGLTMTWEGWCREHVDEGRLVPVLDEYRPPAPELHLYVPRRPRHSGALEALIEDWGEAQRP